MLCPAARTKPHISLQLCHGVCALQLWAAAPQHTTSSGRTRRLLPAQAFGGGRGFLLPGHNVFPLHCGTQAPHLDRDLVSRRAHHLQPETACPV